MQGPVFKNIHCRQLDPLSCSTRSRISRTYIGLKKRKSNKPTTKPRLEFVHIDHAAANVGIGVLCDYMEPKEAGCSSVPRSPFYKAPNYIPTIVRIVRKRHTSPKLLRHRLKAHDILPLLQALQLFGSVSANSGAT